MFDSGIMTIHLVMDFMTLRDEIMDLHQEIMVSLQTVCFCTTQLHLCGMFVFLVLLCREVVQCLSLSVCHYLFVLTVSKISWKVWMHFV